MQLGTRWVTSLACRDRLQTLLFQVAARARKGHGRVRRPRVAGGAFRHQPSPSPVTLVAAQLRMFSSQRPGMVEFFGRRDLGRPRNLRFLPDDRMTELAI